MRKSRSIHTDFHVSQLLQAVGVDAATVERDALAIVRRTWDRAMSHVRLPPKLASLATHQGVMYALRDADDLAARMTTLEDVAAAKRRYETRLLGFTDDGGLHRVCSYLPCLSTGEILMNSRFYCAQHVALALINGLRHKCDGCHLASVMALKGDPTSGGHGHNTVQTLCVPLRDVGVGSGRLWVRVQRFCGDRLRVRYGDALRLVRSGASYLPKDGGPARRVPPNAWCHYGRNGLVDAWLRVEYEDQRTPGVYQPVVDAERLERIRHALRWEDDSVHTERYGFCRPVTKAPDGVDVGKPKSWGQADDGDGW